MYGCPEVSELSLAAIRTLNDKGIRCIVLTKGLLPVELTCLDPMNEYGITLISLNEDYRRRIEPGASPYRNRIESLRQLHERGCQTWVSLEPYPTPNLIQQDLRSILQTISFVDRIVFGRTNYNKQVSSFPSRCEFYNEQARLVEEFCKKNAIAFHIKNGTISRCS